MELEIGVVDMWILIDMIDPMSVKTAGAALDAMHDIAFVQQKFG
jgi:hypothetical protein